MLQTPFTMGDLIRYMNNEDFKSLLSSKQIEIIKNALTAKWTFKLEKELE